MARQLTSKYLERFLEGGVYHNLIEVIKQDPELEFEIRVKNEVMVYFEKCLLLKIGCNSTQSDNIRMLDKNYIKKRCDNLRLTTPLQTTEDFQDIDKIKRYFSEAKALSRNYKSHDEFVVQQAFKREHSSFDDDYLVVDMEWRPDQSDIPPYERISRTRIDLIVVSNRPNPDGKHDVYLAELKCGLNATDGVSGMADHVSKSKEIMRNPAICDKLTTDVAAIIKQKQLLGLIHGTPIKYNFSSRPKMMFILAYRNDFERRVFERKLSSLEAKGYEMVTEYLSLERTSEKTPNFGGMSNDKQERPDKDPKTPAIAPVNNPQTTDSIKQKLKSLIDEARNEWVLNLVDYPPSDMFGTSKAKVRFTAHAPIASMEVAQEKYLKLDTFKVAYNKERGSNNDHKNSAYWYFCHGVKPGDIIYLAKGTFLYAFGVVTGDTVVTDKVAKEHFWNIEWQEFNRPIYIACNIATPFFVNLSINKKKRQALHKAIF